MHSFFPLTVVVFATICLNAGAQSVRYEIPFPKPIGHGADTVSVAIIGDVMMHSRQLEYDHRKFLEGIAPSLREADVAVANMEFSLGGPPYSGYPSFSAPDEYAQYVAEDCGVDVFLTANNHILDKGRKGLTRTLSVYDTLDIKHTGAAADSLSLMENYPLMLVSKGIRIAIVNFTYGTNNPYGNTPGWPAVNLMRRSEVKAAMDRARERKADFIIALPHWGTEYKLKHDAIQQEWAEWLVSEGADAIVGAHPHVVQDTTHIKNVPVIYSTGNVISNMSARNTRLGLVVTLRFTSDTASGDKTMLEPQLRFTWCTLPGTLSDNYRTIFCDEWIGRRDEWIDPSDYDNMITTLSRVRQDTGIGQ